MRDGQKHPPPPLHHFDGVGVTMTALQDNTGGATPTHEQPNVQPARHECFPSQMAHRQQPEHKVRTAA
jgi:hypothetical protein